MTAPRVINHSIRDRLNEANDQLDGGWKYHQAIEDAIAYIAELEDELDILKEEAKGEHSMTQPGDSKMTVTPERALQGVYNAAVAMSVTNKDGAELLLKYHQTLAAALAEAKARGIMVDSFSGLIALSEKATPGDWKITLRASYYHYQVGTDKTRILLTTDYSGADAPPEEREANAEFIVSACNFARTDLPALLAEVERLRWQPIETAPEGRVVMLGWLDPSDAESPEQYHFDCLQDGCWSNYQDHYEWAHSVAPPGSRLPPEAPPYQFWMDIRPFPTAPAKEAQS